MPVDRTLVWTHTAGGVLPDAAEDPWTKAGSATVTIAADGFDVAGSTYYEKELSDREQTEKKRSPDLIDVQCYIRAVTIGTDSTWTTGGSLAISISDGIKMVAVVISTTALRGLSWGNPGSNGAEYGLGSVVQASWDPTVGHIYRVVKERSERFVLYVDGKLMGTLPYTRATDADTLSGYVRIGFHDTAQTGNQALIEQLEMGLNRHLPPQWKVDRIHRTVPRFLRHRWNDLTEAWARTTVGLMEEVSSSIDGMRRWLSSGGNGSEMETYLAVGDELPYGSAYGGTEWTDTRPGAMSLVNERIQFVNANGSEISLATTWLSTAAPSSAVWYIKGKVRVQSYTVGGQSEVGPYLKLEDAARGCFAYLIDDGTNVYWWLSPSDEAGDPTAGAISEPYYVDPYIEHEVGLYLVGEEWWILTVNGRVVARAPYASGHNTAPASQAAVGVLQVAPASCTAQFRDFKAAIRMPDRNFRTFWYQRLVELNLPIGGCEQNGELEIWAFNRLAIMENRGTTSGIREELARLCCSEDIEIVADVYDGEWYLETTYPDILPTFFEGDGDIRYTYAEFPHGPTPNFTDQELADWGAKYLLPISVVERRYHMAVAATMTSNSTVSGGNTRIHSIGGAAGFEAGDAVNIRNAASTVREDTTVISIISSSTIEVALTTNTWVTGDVIRKVLAES